MNDPTNATLSRSQYSHHFYQNPDSFPEFQQNIVYAEELDYMETEQGWFQSFSRSFWSRRVPGNNAPDDPIKTGCTSSTWTAVTVSQSVIHLCKIGSLWAIDYGAALPGARYTSVLIGYRRKKLSNSLEKKTWYMYQMWLCYESRRTRITGRFSITLWSDEKKGRVLWTMNRQEMRLP